MQVLHGVVLRTEASKNPLRWNKCEIYSNKISSVRELGTFRNASMLAYLSNCYNNYDLFKSELVASKLTLYSKFPFWKGEIDGKPDLHFLNTNTLERDLA